MINKIANMPLEEFLELMEITHLEKHEVFALKTFVELKIVSTENKFLKPVLEVDSDKVIDSIDWHNKLTKCNLH